MYSAVITDAISRFERLLHPERDFLFSTGTDEHGSKIQQAAAKNEVTTKQYCDTISHKYKKLFEEASVCPTRFIRTTDEDHKSAVQSFWVSSLTSMEFLTLTILLSFLSNPCLKRVSSTPPTTVAGIAYLTRLFSRKIN